MVDISCGNLSRTAKTIVNLFRMIVKKSFLKIMPSNSESGVPDVAVVTS